MKVMVAGHRERQRLLAGMPVTEHTLELNGIATPVLEGGSGPPIVLLHGPGEHAAKWVRIIPGLVTTHRLIAPDLPGHGSSRVEGGALGAERVLGWLGELIERTCPTPPTLVGQSLGGGIAARFAIEHGDRLARLVLADSLALVPFQPSPEFGSALNEFLERPDRVTFERLWRRCAFDLDRLRDEMGDQWRLYESYTFDRALAPEVQAAQHTLMEEFGLPPIPAEDLARITVPTSLIWGREDIAISLALAESASARYGWPLHVIDASGDDAAMERPEEFLAALRAAIGETATDLTSPTPSAARVPAGATAARPPSAPAASWRPPPPA